MLGGIGLGDWLMGKPHCAWVMHGVVAWHVHGLPGFLLGLGGWEQLVMVKVRRGFFMVK